MKKYTFSRRRIMQLGCGMAAVTLFPKILLGRDISRQGNRIEHPLKKGLVGVPAKPCPNCGMMVNLYARTRHSFTLDSEKYITCSIHCLADMITKSGHQATDINTALYLDPIKMVPAEDALYVIGSDAPGTMTARSKIGFADLKTAKTFVAGHGGKITDLSHALALAISEIDTSYSIIEQRRKKNGLIVEPGPTDRCRVCNMYPARFPKFHSQLRTAAGEVIHFCSSQCLVNFIADQSAYTTKPVTVRAVWVTLYPGGGWEYAGELYYLTGSTIMGPMGPEALPYRRRTEAEALAKNKGGKVYPWDELSPQRILNGL